MAAPTRGPISTPPADAQRISAPDGKATVWMKQWMRAVKGVLSPGINVPLTTLTLAKLTGGGANGSLQIQVVNGIVTEFKYTAPS